MYHEEEEEVSWGSCAALGLICLIVIAVVFGPYTFSHALREDSPACQHNLQSSSNQP